MARHGTHLRPCPAAQEGKRSPLRLCFVVPPPLSSRFPLLALGVRVLDRREAVHTPREPQKIAPVGKGPKPCDAAMVSLVAAVALQGLAPPRANGTSERASFLRQMKPLAVAPWHPRGRHAHTFNIHVNGFEILEAEGVTESPQASVSLAGWFMGGKIRQNATL